MIKKVLISILFFATAIAQAQEATSSPYSLHGLGIQKFRGTVANISMGGLSIYSDPVTVSLQNPASYADLALTSFEIGGTYSSTKLKSFEGNSTGKATSFDYLAISLPTNKFGIGFGLVPSRAVGYDITGINSAGDRTSFEGTGGVNRIYLASGAKVYKGLKLGAEFQYNFGRIINTNTLFPVSADNTRATDQSDISGFSYVLSGIYDHQINEKLLVRGSLIYNGSGNIKSKNEREFTSVATTTEGLIIPAGQRQSIDIADRSFRLPTRLTLGLGLFEKNKWFAGGEIFISRNNDYRDRIQERSTNGRVVGYTRALGFKVGGYYLPKYNSLTSYFSRVIYRTGFRLEQLGLQIDNTSINEFGISFGVGLPLPRGNSALDLGIEIGSRGTDEGVLTKENFFNLSLGLSLSDKWFIKRKYD